MTRIKLNSKTTLIIHDDKSASLIQASYRQDEYDDEVALSPALVLALKQYLNTYIPEEE